MLRKCDADRARKIDLLLLSVGGNDVGFARLVANAVLADKSILRKLGGWFGQVHGFIEANSQLDALDDRMKSVNRALHNLLHVPWPESDRIILTGYPPMALLDDGKTVCPDGQAGSVATPSPKVWVSRCDGTDVTSRSSCALPATTPISPACGSAAMASPSTREPTWRTRCDERWKKSRKWRPEVSHLGRRCGVIIK